jgi:hypothetical protein
MPITVFGDPDAVEPLGFDRGDDFADQVYRGGLEHERFLAMSMEVEFQLQPTLLRCIVRLPTE